MNLTALASHLGLGNSALAALSKGDFDITGVIARAERDKRRVEMVTQAAIRRGAAITVMALEAARAGDLDAAKKWADIDRRYTQESGKLIQKGFDAVANAVKKWQPFAFLSGKKSDPTEAFRQDSRIFARTWILDYGVQSEIGVSAATPVTHLGDGMDALLAAAFG